MNATSPGIVYDASVVSRILGLPCKCDDPVPKLGRTRLSSTTAGGIW